MKQVVRNPVLPGFHPDPSIVRVGADFYLANSTFEWFPGVRLHHSRDLIHWRTAGHALSRTGHLDLRGVADSCGVWAPSLSYADGLFWLTCAVVRTSTCATPFKDTPVILTTAPAIEGPWSDPIRLDAIGFDPSLFHDDDGRKWLLNMQWDFRKGKFRFGGYVVQEFDPMGRCLVGPVHEILRKENVLNEGPNLYKRDGWYYLMMAEGGTGWNHGIAMARSRTITGPYERDPQEAVLTTRHSPDHPLQKAGHGELVQTAVGQWWLAHLCSRPLRTGADNSPPPAGRSALARAHAGDRCILGRETALQRVEWTSDGWLRLAAGGVLPEVEVEAGLAPHPWPDEPARDDFDAPALGPDWAMLRCAAEPSWLSLTERPSWLRLRGRESPSSFHEQSLVAKRVTAFRLRAETQIDFSPARYSQFAGLVAWYDTRMFYYLRVTLDEALGRVVDLLTMDDGVCDEPPEVRFAIGDWAEVHLRADLDGRVLRFFASPDANTWQMVGPELDASKLSDDYHRGMHFTGAFLGLAAHDLAGQGGVADFQHFTLGPL